MCNFSKSDVLILASAVIEDNIDYYDGDHGEEWSCYYCLGKSNIRSEDVKHDLDCPVLVAQDVLTSN